MIITSASYHNYEHEPIFDLFLGFSDDENTIDNERPLSSLNQVVSLPEVIRAEYIYIRYEAT